jgi:hypothetical protein
MAVAYGGPAPEAERRDWTDRQGKDCDGNR